MKQISSALAVLLVVLAALTARAAAPQGKVTPLRSAKDRIRVAAVQLPVPSHDYLKTHDTVDSLLPLIERAGREKTDLLVFPEYLLGDYKLKSPLIDKLCQAAHKHHVNVIAGGWERLPEFPITHPVVPKTYANTLVVISREGKVAGTYRKKHPALGAHSPYCWPPEPGEMGELTMVWGEDSPVIDLDFGRIGLLTCYDGFFFSSFEIPSLKGAEILIWANGRSSMLEDYIIKSASFMTCTHVISTNLSVGAGTSICAYPANILATTLKPGDTYISAELDLRALRIERKNNRMMHQRRPEIYGDQAKSWAPWEAYPDIEAFQYPQAKAEPR